MAPSSSNSKNTGLLAFLRSVKVELDLVKWPDRQETIRLTTIVVVASLIVAVYIGGLDYIFTQLVTLIVTR